MNFLQCMNLRSNVKLLVRSDQDDRVVLFMPLQYYYGPEFNGQAHLSVEICRSQSDPYGFSTSAKTSSSLFQRSGCSTVLQGRIWVMLWLLLCMSCVTHLLCFDASC